MVCCCSFDYQIPFKRIQFFLIFFSVVSVVFRWTFTVSLPFTSRHSSTFSLVYLFSFIYPWRLAMHLMCLTITKADQLTRFRFAYQFRVITSLNISMSGEVLSFLRLNCLLFRPQNYMDVHYYFPVLILLLWLIVTAKLHFSLLNALNVFIHSALHFQIVKPGFQDIKPQLGKLCLLLIFFFFSWSTQPTSLYVNASHLHLRAIH